MHKSIYTIMFVLLFFAANSQDAGKIVKTIKGKVINLNTNEAISYTNIGLEGTFYGTASDGDGNFLLKIPEEFSAKNIYFSAVGFKNKVFPVKDLFEKELVIVKLESQSYGIDDIDIAAQSKVLIRILRMASENIPTNFIGGPVNFSGIYNFNRKSDSNTDSRQMNIKMFDKTGYVTPSKINAFHSRKYELETLGDHKKAVLFSEGKTNVDEILELDWVRSASSVLNPELLADFALQLKNNAGDSNIWVIGFSKNNPGFALTNDFYATSIEGEIVIGKTDYDIKKISAKIESKKHSLQGKSLALKNDNQQFKQNVSYNFLVEYENLIPQNLTLSKKYTYNGEAIEETSSINFTGVEVSNVSVIKGRDYFVE